MLQHGSHVPGSQTPSGAHRDKPCSVRHEDGGSCRLCLVVVASQFCIINIDRVLVDAESKDKWVMERTDHVPIPCGRNHLEGSPILDVPSANGDLPPADRSQDCIRTGKGDRRNPHPVALQRTLKFPSLRIPDLQIGRRSATRATNNRNDKTYPDDPTRVTRGQKRAGMTERDCEDMTISGGIQCTEIALSVA